MNNNKIQDFVNMMISGTYPTFVPGPSPATSIWDNEEGHSLTFHDLLSPPASPNKNDGGFGQGVVASREVDTGFLNTPTESMDQLFDDGDSLQRKLVQSSQPSDKELGFGDRLRMMIEQDKDLFSAAGPAPGNGVPGSGGIFSLDGKIFGDDIQESASLNNSREQVWNAVVQAHGLVLTSYPRTRPTMTDATIEVTSTTKNKASGVSKEPAGNKKSRKTAKPGKVVVCQHCKKSCVGKTMLKRHMKVHAEGTVFCQYCGAGFKHKATHTIHEKMCSQ